MGCAGWVGCWIGCFGVVLGRFPGWWVCLLRGGFGGNVCCVLVCVSVFWGVLLCLFSVGLV